MPIVDIEFIGPATAAARDIADALGDVFGTPAGRTWARLRTLAAEDYAENGVEVAADELPVFVTVLHARPPTDEALATEVEAVTKAVARVAGRDPTRVHVQYAPAAAGRQAFGGRLVGGGS